MTCHEVPAEMRGLRWQPEEREVKQRCPYASHKVMRRTGSTDALIRNFDTRRTAVRLLPGCFTLVESRLKTSEPQGWRRLGVFLALLGINPWSSLSTLKLSRSTDWGYRRVLLQES